MRLISLLEEDKAVVVDDKLMVRARTVEERMRSNERGFRSPDDDARVKIMVLRSTRTKRNSILVDAIMQIGS
jgi:hypothetical protein